MSLWWLAVDFFVEIAIDEDVDSVELIGFEIGASRNSH